MPSVCDRHGKNTTPDKTRCCTFIEYADGQYAAIMPKPKVVHPPFKLSGAEFEECRIYIEQLCKEAKQTYLEASKNSTDITHWPFDCERALSQFIINRDGWKLTSINDGLYMFKEQYPAEVNILKSKSTGKLLVDMAIAVAVAETSEKIAASYPDTDVSGVLLEIERMVTDQDWVIGFSRAKINT